MNRHVHSHMLAYRSTTNTGPRHSSNKHKITTDMSLKRQDSEENNTYSQDHLSHDNINLLSNRDQSSQPQPRRSSSLAPTPIRSNSIAPAPTSPRKASYLGNNSVRNSSINIRLGTADSVKQRVVRLFSVATPLDIETVKEVLINDIKAFG